MDGDDVTKRYLKEQLDILGIKNLTERELDKYTEGITEFTESLTNLTHKFNRIHCSTPREKKS